MDAEWKPEYVYTLIFGKTNQIKDHQLPGKLKDYKPETTNLFSPMKGNITIFIFYHQSTLLELQIFLLETTAIIFYLL